MPSPPSNPRRHWLQLSSARLLAVTAGFIAWPKRALASESARPIVEVSEGPFYPPARWRAQWTDWDADLTRVKHREGSPVARGEALGLEGDLVDATGRRIDGAEVEIWQCDALAAYHHPRVQMAPGRFDPGFAGFGATRTEGDGVWRFRTIRPVSYPGRTPHIHLKLRHASFGEVTSQLFVAGDPGNEADFLFRRIAAADRSGVSLRFAPAPSGSGLTWMARHRLVVPA
jgi:protocatechuate 3,4-dioxygenase, beta subunit